MLVPITWDKISIVNVDVDGWKCDKEAHLVVDSFFDIDICVSMSI